MGLRHPNIAPLLGYIDEQDFCMVSPWFGKGNIGEYLRKTKPRLRARFSLTQEIATGVAYLHTLSPVVIHGDLKPDNIVVDKHDVPRTIDFGLSKALEEESGSGFGSSSSHHGAGNSRWIAPEQVMEGGSARSTNSDVYSFACVAFFIMTGEQPFGNEHLNDLQVSVARINGGQPMESVTPYPAMEVKPGLHAYDLLLRCWAEDRVERPSMPTVIDTPASF